MTLYKRKWNCAVCRKPLFWDSDAKTLTCGCGVQPNVTFVNMEAFEPVPKYDRKFWEGITLPIDSAKFLSTEILLDGSQVLFISDRESIFKGNEDPQMNVRWIKYPEKNKTQVCLEIIGRFHTEKLAYNKKNAKEWKGRMWIYLPREIIPKLVEYLQKDPHKLEVWMQYG